MTEGSSQGLFLVVAIVIFGIFVSLAYNVFGSEGLSNELNHIFKDTIEQAQDSFIANKKEKLLVETIYLDTNKYLNLEKDIKNNSVNLNSIGGGGGGIAVPTQEFSEIGKTYEFRFSMTLNSGVVDTLGGHLGMSDTGKVTVKVNNVEKEMKDYYVDNPWANGVPIDIKVGETIDVVVIFEKTKEDMYADSPIKIQPNRNWYVGYDKDKGLDYGYGKPFDVTVANFNIIEYK